MLWDGRCSFLPNSSVLLIPIFNCRYLDRLELIRENIQESGAYKVFEGDRCGRSP